VKLMRIGEAGAERPAALDEDGRVHDLSGTIEDVDARLLADPAGLDALRRVLATGGLPEITTAGLRLGPPLAGIGKIVCIGLNYRDHAAETGASIPAEPIVFMKAPDTVVGPNDDVLVPRGSTRTDWEVELGVVIGTTARYLDTDEQAHAAIAGYVLSHDVSEREFQIERGGQWDKGKNCETFNPLGPYFVTADEIADPGALDLRLWVNGELRQNGTTADMIFGVDYLVRYLSQFMVLRPGDIINTGTPAGVAMGRGSGYLRPGDVVELEITGLGRARQTFRSYQDRD
jgi:2-keto-4-pentenoate hydratase/2-oxohepta-3-ene-1,7-dioic acid hydratase in catechol pathway